MGTMHAVAEMIGFSEDAEAAGMSAQELAALVDRLAANPQAGEMIVGTGGARKVRVAGRGKGKSGGFRVISYYTGDDLPVFLVTVFSKGKRADLAGAERAKIKKELADLASDYRKGVREWAKLLRRS
jgi:hypothetical protein